MTRTEFRITVKRAGRAPRTLIKCSEATARRCLTLLGPEPWRVFAPEAEADDYVCCPGTAYNECGCGGETYGEHAKAERAKYSPVQWVRVESRTRTWSLTKWADAVFRDDATVLALGAVEANPNEPDEKWEGGITPADLAARADAVREREGGPGR